MQEKRRELLLILAADQPASESRGGYRVTQRISPRVVIVEPASGVTKENLRTMNGVDVVLEPGEIPSEETKETLTDIEMLFVNGYTQRSRHKERPGEGLDWDAEGFLPPDPPPKR